MKRVIKHVKMSLVFLAVVIVVTSAAMPSFAQISLTPGIHLGHGSITVQEGSVEMVSSVHAKLGADVVVDIDGYWTVSGLYASSEGTKMVIGGVEHDTIANTIDSMRLKVGYDAYSGGFASLGPVIDYQFHRWTYEPVGESRRDVSMGGLGVGVHGALTMDSFVVSGSYTYRPKVMYQVKEGTITLADEQGAGDNIAIGIVIPLSQRLVLTGGYERGDLFSKGDLKVGMSEYKIGAKYVF